MAQPRFKVKFQEIGVGKEGGMGPPKTFICTAKNSAAAQRKLRKRGRIISVRKF